jgi:hypothetical protein
MRTSQSTFEHTRRMCRQIMLTFCISKCKKDILIRVDCKRTSQRKCVESEQLKKIDEDI